MGITTLATKQFASVLLVVVTCAVCVGQDGGAAELKRRVEELEAKLSLAEKAAELLEEEVEELRKENSRLKGGEAKRVLAEVDPFRAGAVWKGEAKGKGKVAHWAVSVSERDGRNFRGAVAIVANDKTVELPVSGTAPATGNGPVVIQSALVGRAQLFLRGRLSNGEIALAYSGTTALGEKIVGAATLRPKN